MANSQVFGDELYSISWSNPACSHLLCSANVLDYFCDLSNPFYDRQCNNEVIRMQRLSTEQLLCMTGVEFYLHSAQEPILFVIRKQQRLSSTQVTPLAYYYVINGTVLQAPDLSTLVHSRLLTTVSSLTKLLQTLAPCARYHPSDGSYSWDDPNTLLGLNVDSDSKTSTSTSPSHVNSSSRTESVPPNLFQVQRTDFLLADWATRFPLPSATFINQSVGPTPNPSQQGTGATPANVTIAGASSVTATPSSFTVKDEPTAPAGQQQQSRPPPKTPVIPGVGANAISLSSNTFSPALPLEKKLRPS
ncbi:unnamed protein product [Calicophoron daubneyi]|uniref:Mediator of RNA polymerase II transcription subunit 6 n=1 Tax=Calicophoron daubneyi TaxID=300641 RepID=A0AAV2TJ86_CALDB